MDAQFSTENYKLKKEHAFPSGLFKSLILLAIILLTMIAYHGHKQQQELNTLLLKEIEAEKISNDIIYYDEVLTMSARLAILTGKPNWQQRYSIYVKKLDDLLKHAQNTIPQVFNVSLEQQTITTANNRLVTMENKAFELLKNGQKEKANKLLFGATYEKYKQIYAEAVLSFRDKVHHLLGSQGKKHIDSAFNFSLYIGLCVALLIYFAFALFRRVAKWQSTLNHELKTLYKNNRNYHLILSSAGEGIYGVDNKGITTFVNHAACTILGFEPNELIGKPMHDHIHYAFPNGVVYPVEKSPIFASYKNKETHQIDNEVFWHKSRHAIPIRYTSTPIFHYDDVEGAVVTFIDISQEIKAQKNLQQRSYIDRLTGLPNRYSFTIKIEEVLSHANRGNSIFAVMFIDMDNFKSINDTRGHELGDKVICELGNRLKGCIRKNDYIARIGGDEFAIIFQHLAAPEYARHAAQNIISHLKMPLVVNDQEISTTVSLGIAIFPLAAKTPAGLLKKADIAMYKAKELGKNQFIFYTDELNQRVARIQAIEKELSTAISKNELQLYYQPVVNSDGELICVEALLRWHNQTLDNPSPAEFIPIAEQTLLINQIGLWVLETALQDIVEFRKINQLNNLRMSVNISPKQLAQENFVSTVKEVISQRKVPTESIVFEITETSLMTNIQKMSKKLESLRSLGIRISLDDFGTGYSSMLYLKKLPIHYLKIDKEFIRDIILDENDAAIVKTMIELSKNFNLIVIAEGVETTEQKDFLNQNQCDLFQGYLFDRPMSKLSLIKKYG